MIKLLAITAICMVFALISHNCSDYSHSMERYRRKDKVFYTIMAVFLILFAGLRTWYNDTSTYLLGYDLIKIDGTVFDSVKDWSIGGNPGFNLVNSIMKHAGVSRQSFIMIYAVVTLSIYLWFLHKYTTNIWQTAFLFMIAGCYLFTLAAIKQCIAVAFCLLAVDQLLKKNYVRFALWILVAVTFHPYAIMFAVMPWLAFRPWSRKTYISLVAFGLAGLLLQSLLGTIVDVTSMLGEEYDAASFSGEGINPFRLAVTAVPLVISFLARFQIEDMDEDQEKANFLFTNLAILNAEIMFVGLFGTANYFARLANYFQIFQVLALPWLFRFFTPQSKRGIIGLAVVGYILFSFYENGILRPFDNGYSYIPLVDYLKSLF
jgi:transmembrane protein EpsG